MGCNTSKDAVLSVEDNNTGASLSATDWKGKNKAESCKQWNKYQSRDR
jgi:hypothetical protein